MKRFLAVPFALAFACSSYSDADSPDDAPVSPDGGTSDSGPLSSIEGGHGDGAVPINTDSGVKPGGFCAGHPEAFRCLDFDNASEAPFGFDELHHVGPNPTWALVPSPFPSGAQALRLTTMAPIAYGALMPLPTGGPSFSFAADVVIEKMGFVDAPMMGVALAGPSCATSLSIGAHASDDDAVITFFLNGAPSDLAPVAIGTPLHLEMASTPAPGPNTSLMIKVTINEQSAEIAASLPASCLTFAAYLGVFSGTGGAPTMSATYDNVIVVAPPK